MNNTNSITGSFYKGNGKCSFTVWAPFLREVSLKVISPENRLILMEKDEAGYWETTAEDVSPDTLYLYELNGNLTRPDPASHFQPEGVHGPSQVIDHGSFIWEESFWKGLPLEDYVVYELHVGTFTEKGTFEAIIPCLSYLKELGVTALELMPVAQFPGNRDWGYDGTYPYAVQNSYGGPRGLKQLVNECHRLGLAVILDVVYNHLGPEGNYLRDFGPYFTNKYNTPWGEAINFDGPYSDEVRKFFIYNALHWITLYHIDALRIDAIHGIYDSSARHFLLQLGDEVHRAGNVLERNVYLIAESDLNDVRVVNPVEIGGYGLDAQWNDDFHHSLHTLLTGENNGYYQDFGKINDLADAYREGFVYSGRYSRYRKKSHGNSSKGRPGRQFIVFSQNHDQIGNRLPGDRLSQTQSLEKLKLAASAVIFSPFIPLLFMGEEYGEVAPFNYFVSYYDSSLIEAVRQGRHDEFAAFHWKGTMPDPQAEETFMQAKLNMELRHTGTHKVLFEFYRHIILLRKGYPAFVNHKKDNMEVGCFEAEKTIYVKISSDDGKVFYVCNFSVSAVQIDMHIPDCGWNKILDSSSVQWGGPGEVSAHFIEPEKTDISLHINPFSIILYRSVANSRI